MRQTTTLLLAGLLAVGAAGATSSCSSHTTTTTRTVERPSDESSSVRTETTETTETHDSDGPHGGILSGTINAIGFILALPFKIVGGLIEIIF